MDDYPYHYEDADRQVDQEQRNEFATDDNSQRIEGIGTIRSSSTISRTSSSETLSTDGILFLLI